MNKLIITVFLFGSYLIVFGQQDPQYTQFMFNTQLYNPASTGFYGRNCATLLARTQYTRYEDQTYYLNDQADNKLALRGAKGAKTLTFSFGAPIKLKRKAKNKQIGGIGLSVYSDEVGYLKTDYYKLDLAFRKEIKSAFFGFGTTLGAMQKQIDLNGLVYKDPLDPKIPNTVNTSNVNMNVGAGLWFYAPKLNDLTIGYAVQNLSGTPFRFSGVSSLSQGMHQYLNVQAEFKPFNVVVSPYLLLKTGQQTAVFNNATANSGSILFPNPDATAGVLIDVLPRFQVGTGLRASTKTIESVNAMMCFYATSNLKMGYAYDFNTSQLNTNNNNTHEIMLKYCFLKEKFRNVRDPRHLDRNKVYDRFTGEL